jgi:NADP-dependent 3-hydroxy acid dehydrogenase YdfG
MGSIDPLSTTSDHPDGGQRVAVVTGASAGIGAATARTLAAQGFHVVAVARRADRINALAAEIGGTAIVADVTDDAAIDALADGLNRVDVLVNNAGGAKGLAPVADADLEHWRWMWETNVLGTLRVTRALLPKLIDSGDGLIVTVTSIAALETYDNGSGYTAAKHAQGALHRTLRGELLGKPVRLTEIAPGAVERCRRGDRFRGIEATTRRPRPDRHPAARSGARKPVQPPGSEGLVAVVGVPDSVGASFGVTGALRGIDTGAGLAPEDGGSADIPTQVSQGTAQSQMSPSE